MRKGRQAPSRSCSSVRGGKISYFLVHGRQACVCASRGRQAPLLKEDGRQAPSQRKGGKLLSCARIRAASSFARTRRQAHVRALRRAAGSFVRAGRQTLLRALKAAGPFFVCARCKLLAPRRCTARAAGSMSRGGCCGNANCATQRADIRKHNTGLRERPSVLDTRLAPTRVCLEVHRRSCCDCLVDHCATASSTHASAAE